MEYWWEKKYLPYIIIYAYEIMYPHIPKIYVPYHMSYAVMASAASIVCTMGATLASCYKELAAEPAVLMRPPAPKKRAESIPGKNRIHLETDEFHLEINDQESDAL